jgi:ferredoxin--NADP+ reductase
VYVTGWIKRGATGGIGANRLCGEETAQAVIADFAAGLLPDPALSRDEIPRLLDERAAMRIDGSGWERIDFAERSAGAQVGRGRIKMVTIAELVTAAKV